MSDMSVIVDGKEVDPTGLDWAHYRKTALAEAVQIHDPFLVKTLEGTFEAKPGDYLMRGPAGELYSCDRTIFEDTYVPAEETK